MAAFTESGMLFDLPDERLFRIEKSPFYTRKTNLSSVECLYSAEEELLWIEAKSSFPREENDEDFHKNLDEISNKFIHSFELFSSHFVGVNQLPADTPPRFLNYDFSNKKPIKFVLIINCKKIKPADIPNMITTINNQFLKIFKWHKSIWNTDFITLDHKTAIERGYVKKLEE